MPKSKSKKKKVSLDAITDSNKEILFDILEREGVETCCVSFDGGGDDGQIEESDLPESVKKIVVKGSKVLQGVVWSAGGNRENWKDDPTVGEIVDSICHNVLETLWGGWENNDGAFGDFVFDVKERSVSFNFNARYVESELHEYDF